MLIALAGCKKDNQPVARLDYPKNDLEIVVHTSPGDGADMYVRAISEAINKNKLMPVVTVVINKTGGSGANMYNYMKQKKGNPYYLMTCQPNILTSPIRNNLDVTYVDFTPVAGLAIENLVIAVNAKSNIMNMQDLIREASKGPKAVTQAGGTAGATEYFLSYKIEQETGVVFNLLPHAGGGSEAMITLLSGNADFMIADPSEVIGQVEANTLRIIAVGTRERIPLVPDVPTVIEQGINASIEKFLGVAMPGDIPEEIQAYMADVMKKVTETKEWKDYCVNNGLMTNYMNTAEFMAFLKEQNTVFRNYITSYGDRFK
jgi:putative tricarboxylic transport membrane protein